MTLSSFPEAGLRSGSGDIVWIVVVPTGVVGRGAVGTRSHIPPPV